MLEQVTIVVVPRDRFSSVSACIRSIIENTAIPFRLDVLDFGYSAYQLAELQQMCRQKPLNIIPCGRTIPLEAFRNYLNQVRTPYVAWVDNDTNVTASWLEALLDRAARGAFGKPSEA